MKKCMLKTLICCLILAMDICVEVYAENVNDAEIVSSTQPEYILDELGIGLDLPEELVLVSTQKKEDYDNNGMIAIYGEDGVNSMVERLKNNNIYLYAAPLRSDYTIRIYMLQDLSETGILGMTTEAPSLPKQLFKIYC